MKFTIGKKFGSLLAAFLALQVLQLGIGIYQVRHVAEEADHLSGVGRLRPAFLAELARRSLASGSHRPMLQQQLLDALAAQDRIYRHLNAAYGKKTADPEYADIARSVIEAHDVWEKELLPLIRSVYPTRPETARATLVRYEALFPVQAGRLAQIVTLLEQHMHEEVLVSVRNHASIFLLSTLFALITAWAVRRHVTAPLHVLAQASQSMAGGAYDQRLSIASRDELGQLAGAFNDMATNLETRRQIADTAVAELQKSEQLLGRIFDTTHILIAYLDPDFNFIRVNRAYAEAGKQPPEFFVGKNHFALYPGAEVETIFRQVVETGRPYTTYARPFEYPDQPGRGVTWWDWTVSPVRDSDGHVSGVVFSLLEVTERVKAEQRAGYLHLHDELTGLPNRTLLLDRLNQTLIESGRHKREAAVMCLDLDHFKTVNETLGHAAGDALLKQAAERLTQCVRPGDTVARIAGDQFAVVLADMASVDDVGRIIQKLMGCGAKPFSYESHEYFLSVSLGVALFPFDGQDATQLLKSAELAMHQAKERGGNSYQFYSRPMADRAAEQLALSNDMRRALERGEFLLYYQPQVDVASGRIVGAEALIRWKHPERGLVSPATFIPLAEENGLIAPLGEWVLRQACDQLRAWMEAGLPSLRVAVNVSAHQFRHNNLAHSVERALRDCVLPPHRLEIEITESTLVTADGTPLAMLQKISDLGVGISVDDFGTGYSALSYLRRFPIDSVKIDKSFVNDMATDNDAAALVNAIVAMAHGLELKVVAEGVERKDQLALLLAYGCDLAQGFYFSPPLPADEFARLLREQHACCRGKDYVN